jgi:pilus assembly protein Flp/PilA
MLELITRFLRDEAGQGLAEYALILVLIAVAVIVALTALGGQIGDIFDSIKGTLKNPPEPA